MANKTAHAWTGTRRSQHTGKVTAFKNNKASKTQWQEVAGHGTSPWRGDILCSSVAGTTATTTTTTVQIDHFCYLLLCLCTYDDAVPLSEVWMYTLSANPQRRIVERLVWIVNVVSQYVHVDYVPVHWCLVYVGNRTSFEAAQVQTDVFVWSDLDLESWVLTQPTRRWWTDPQPQREGEGVCLKVHSVWRQSDIGEHAASSWGYGRR